MIIKLLKRRFAFIPSLCAAVLCLICVCRIISVSGLFDIDFVEVDKGLIKSSDEPEPMTGIKHPLMPEIAISGVGDIDINNATAEELDKIPGIGKKKAKAIVEQRIEMGGFSTPEDIVCTKGIGVDSFEKLEKYIKVSEYTGNDCK